jgi:uncharacterized protein Usg
MRWLRASHLVHVSASQAGVARRPPHANALLEKEDSMTSRVGAVSEDFRKLALGYGLTTAEILYRMPDHPSLLQSYVWQNYDLFPRFPALKDFLKFWEQKLEGPLFKVTVAHSKLIKPAELRAVDGVFRLH